ncbi:MAG: thiol:disulfide interchange protein [Flavobacteriaceae bacterium]|nr:thiol:disulfide interchange protein [Flavobacteriaceae bacterium]
MRNLIQLFVAGILLYSCSSGPDNNMFVSGEITGLKKGKLYLQKMQDTVLVSVDSVALLGNSKFELSDYVSSPVLYYLTFDGNTTDKRILFFGEEGNISIQDNVEKFGLNPEIKGSANQEKLDKFNEVNQQFNSQRLDLIKEELEAKQKEDQKALEGVQKKYQSLQRRRVLYVTNYALSNSDSEVAPYLGMTEMYNANIKLLDTVYNSLSERVKASDYGKRFKNYIAEIKSTEK